MTRFLLAAFAGWLIALLPAGAGAASSAPDEMIRTLSTQILERIRQDPELKNGDIAKLSRFVDEAIMPNVNFERMTALSVGRSWRQATPEQQKALMAEYRALLLRTYAGALSAVKDQQVRVKPLRGAAGDAEVIVRSEIVQTRGEPIQLDYRMEKVGDAWKIYDLNIMGVWLVETYRSQFAQEIGNRGVDGLIKSLNDRNRQFAQSAKAS
jgi:phospholipid transport system substrate-binding protein